MDPYRKSRLSALGLVMLLLSGCASAVRTVADSRALDAESAARLIAEGGLLYEEETVRRSGYEYCSLAVSLIDRGDLRLGIREASKALFLGETGRNQCLIANAKRDLATAYLFAGQLERAGEYAQDAISGSAGCRTNEPQPARSSKKVLGDVLLRQGKPGEAIKQYEELQSGTDYWAQVATISLANAHVTAGNYRQAADQLARAKAASTGNVTLAAMVTRGLGQLALAEGRYGDAATLFEQASASAGGTDAAYHQLWALDGLARSRVGGGDRAGAVAAYRQAIAIAERVRVRFRSEEFRTGFFGEIQHIFDRAVALLVDDGEAEAALGVSEQSRARALEDLIRGRVAASAQGQVVADAVGRAASASDIRAVLRPGLVLIEYHLTDLKGFAWIVRHSGVQVISINTSRDALARQIRSFRNRIGARDPGADEVGVALYQLLIAPLQLAKDEHAVVVPHGPLHYLPFQALRGQNGYLIEERAISYVPSASALRALLARNPGQPDRVLALGNPDVGDPRLALPGAEREVHHIKTRFPAAEIYIRKDATKARLLDTSPRSDLIHIGAHADVDEVDPLYSLIYLAPSDRRPGQIEAHEVYSLGLPRAPVVVLSACNTGLGRVARGDEILGFARTFLAAGARTLLVSLWPVDDLATARLMEQFYDRLGSSSGEAVRVAQLKLLRDTTTKHPFFWASFNLVGDPR